MSISSPTPKNSPSLQLKALVGVIIVGALAALLLFANGARKRAYTQSMSEVVMVASSTGSPATLTLPKFNNIKIGMSYAQVVAIIGAPGIMVAQDSTTKAVTEWYVWQNRGNANMTVTFRRGKVTRKVQSGLQ